MGEAVQDYVCLDLETTGLRPKFDKIIEIGAARVRGGEIQETFETFVRPGIALPERIAELTGISEADLEVAPAIGEALPDFLAFTQGLPFLGHNVSFDFAFLKRAAANAGFELERSAIDTLKLARKFLPQLPGRRLADLCAHYEIPLRNHRALPDACAAHFLYRRLCEEFYREEDFAPFPLVCRVKKEGPATRAQKERLKKLCDRYGIRPDFDPDLLTKNEASRLIDRILAAYGILQK